MEEVLDDVVLRTYKQARDRELSKLWPKPTQGDIESLFHWLQPRFDVMRGNILKNREVRYMRDATPKKWQETLQDGRRVRTRLTHNEIARVRGMITGTHRSVHVPATGDNPKAIDRAQAQTRWAKEFLNTLDAGTRPVLQQVLDNVLGDGIGAFEFALREHTIYDDISADPITVPAAGGVSRKETPADAKRRVQRLTQGAPLPFVVRKVDPMMLHFEERYDEVSRVLIVEWKPRHSVFGALAKAVDKRGLSAGDPDAGTPGWGYYERAIAYSDENYWYSADLGSASAQMNSTESVLTFRYYDPRWYMYIVGGVLVDVAEHKLPRLPVIICPGLVTGSDAYDEMFEGITWGLADMERTFNDLLTKDVDAAFTFGRPRPVIVRDIHGLYPDDVPANLDLSGRGAPRLFPGETVDDAFKGFQYRPSPVAEIILQMFSRSALSPIAQGAVSSAMAGYTVNTAAQQSLSQYEPVVANWSKALGQLIDLARWTIRDTVKLPCGLAIPGPNNTRADWLWIGPDDIDEVRAIVVVDPMAEANKQAATAQAMQANKEGYMPRREVQVTMGADDPDEWDDRIALDVAREQLLQNDLEEAQRRRAAQEAQDTGQVPPNIGGQVLPNPTQGQGPQSMAERVNQMQRQGTAPADMNPPEVEPNTAAAARLPFESSSGPAAMNSAQARAGMPSP